LISHKGLRLLTIVAPSMLAGSLALIYYWLTTMGYSWMYHALAMIAVVILSSVVFSNYVFGVFLRIEGKLKREKETTAALYELSQDISSSLFKLEKNIITVLEKTRTYFQADMAGWSLIDETSEEVICQGIVGSLSRDYRALKVGHGEDLAGEVIISGKIIKFEDFPKDTDKESIKNYPILKAEKLRAVIALPISQRDRVFGTLVVGYRKPHHFTTDEERFLITLANNLGIAIENAQMYNRVQSLAAIEERERLAREMHDGFAQALTYMNFHVTGILGELDKKNYDKAEKELQEMKGVIKQTYEEVRQAIFDLKHTAIPQGEFIKRLTTYLSEFGKTAGLETRIVVKDELNPKLHPDIEVQLIRIVQEALVNVRKHANATRVVITLERCSVGLRIIIEDNGQGFVVEDVEPQVDRHYGLGIMRERAESIGAILTVESTLKEGTRVIVEGPITHKGGLLNGRQ